MAPRIVRNEPLDFTMPENGRRNASRCIFTHHRWCVGARADWKCASIEFPHVASARRPADLSLGKCSERRDQKPRPLVPRLYQTFDIAPTCKQSSHHAACRSLFRFGTRLRATRQLCVDRRCNIAPNGRTGIGVLCVLWHVNNAGTGLPPLGDAVVPGAHVPQGARRGPKGLSADQAADAVARRALPCRTKARWLTLAV